MEILNWIQIWYKSQCDGDWEHSYGIKINTIDNPGWSVSIDLNGTDLKGLYIKKMFQENNENDWYSLQIEDSCFKGYGDPNKLNFLLTKFKEIVEKEK